VRREFDADRSEKIVVGTANDSAVHAPRRCALWTASQQLGTGFVHYSAEVKLEASQWLQRQKLYSSLSHRQSLG